MRKRLRKKLAKKRRAGIATFVLFAPPPYREGDIVTREAYDAALLDFRQRNPDYRDRQPPVGTLIMAAEDCDGVDSILLRSGDSLLAFGVPPGLSREQGDPNRETTRLISESISPKKETPGPSR